MIPVCCSIYSFESLKREFNLYHHDGETSKLAALS